MACILLNLDMIFSIIRTGIDATGRDLSVISNNLANASTNGFKRSEAQFEDIYQSHHNNSTEVARGMGVKTIKPRQNFSQGSFQQTNGSLDLAIMGEGFFVLGEKGHITVKNGPFHVDESGLIHFDGKISDSFRLVRFRHQDQLQKLGRGFFAPVNKDDLPKVSSNIQIKQGILEDSNVNSMLEMTRMISATRAYESVHKALSRIDRLDEKAISMLQA